MRINNTLQGRPPFYDRTLTNISNGFNATLAPPAQTTEFSYTVPSLRKAHIAGGEALVFRVTAATTALLATSVLQSLPNGGNPHNFMVAEFNNNAVGALDRALGSLDLYMVAGDQVKHVVQSTDTGGTVQYQGAIEMNEYDA